jgi:hypothetical protein
MVRGFDLRYRRHWVAFVSHRWLLNVNCLQNRLVLDSVRQVLRGSERDTLGEID